MDEFDTPEFYPQRFYPNAQNVIDTVWKNSKGKILDAGCGCGWLDKQLAEKGAKLCGVDMDISVAKRFLKGEKVELKKAPLTKICYPNKSFDTVVCLSVLEHVYDLEKSKKELLRVLRPNGNLIITMPNKYGLFSLMYDMDWKRLKWKTFDKEFSCREQMYGKGHLRHLTVGEQARLFSDLFKSTKIVKINFLTPLFIKLFKEKSYLPIRIDQAITTIAPHFLTGNMVIFCGKKAKPRE